MTSEMSEEQVKKTILSLLTSTPQVTTIITLQKDFKDLIGHAIPFSKFNYNSVEHFLKSISDVCTVNNSGPHAQVYPRISENSAHIKELVSRQKSTPKRRNNYRGAAFIRKPAISRYNTYQYNYAFSANSSWSNSSYGNYEGPRYNRNFAPRFRNSSTPVPKALENGPKPSENCTAATPDKNVKNSNANTNKSSINDGDRLSVRPAANNELTSKKVEETPKEENETKNQNMAGLGSTSVGNVSEPAYTSSASKESLASVQSWINSNNNIIPDNAPKDISNYLHQSCEGPSIDTCTKNLTCLDINDAKETKNEDTSNVPKKVQSNLKTLISQFEDGIWVPDLPEQYRQMFRRELAWMEYGYTSLIDMCVACGHIFHYVRPERGDFKLYDRNKPLPANAERKFTMASYDTKEKKGPIFHEDALPELDFSDFRGRIPDDIFEYGNEIARQFVPEGTKAESVLDVVVVEIYDPSKFWFYLGTSDNNSILDQLMDQIKIFYEDPENARRYSIPLGAVKEGLYCVQIIYGEYHRARVVRVYPDDSEHVGLLYIDYGTLEKTKKSGMCFLRSDFATTPAQAIRCRLANIKPILKGHPWPRATSGRFRELVNRRDTKIKISYIDWREEYVCVFLADVTDPDVVYINELLVKERHAVWDDEKQISPFVLSNFKCKVQNLHLFPTFLELEYGMAPNAAEMYTLQEMLVPLHFCIPQYFERNIEVSSDTDSDIEFESAFIETVKHHRKIIPWHKIDFRNVSRPATINFNVFGEMKEEMMSFFKEINGTNKIASCEINEECFVDCDELLDSNNQSLAATHLRRTPEYDELMMISENRIPADNTTKQIDRPKFDESYLSDEGIKNGNHEELTPLVEYTSYSCGGRNNYKKIALVDEDPSDLEFSTILELSESEKDLTLSPLTCKPFSTLDIDSTPEVNIFDNPEAFENSSESISPVTSQEFIKPLEDQVCSRNSELGSDGQTYSSSYCQNPFKFNMPFQSDDPFDMFLKRHEKKFVSSVVCDKNKELSLPKDLPDSNSVLSSAKKELNFLTREVKMKFKRIDLPCKSALGDARTETISSLRLNNPFIDEVLHDQKYPEAVGAGISEKTKVQDEATTTKPESNRIEFQPESDSSDYQALVSKPEPPTPPAPNNKDIKIPPNDLQIISTESCDSVSTDDTRSTGQMSIHAEVFVPMRVSYHQGPYGSWSLPQYPQWSNGGYPAPYPVYQPPPQQEPPVRPPPGFSSIPAYTPNKYQNVQPGHPQLNPYVMPRMAPPTYTAHYQAPPVYYNRPPSQVMPQEDDFYEAYNKKPGANG